MKRAGFTMIELIFVIVILGILAAVAIPKLAATRNDAKVASEMTSVAQVIQNLGAEYVATGDIKAASITEANSATNCFTIAAGSNTSTDGNITVTGTASNSTACNSTLSGLVNTKAAKNSILNADKSAKTFSFGGSGIVE